MYFVEKLMTIENTWILIISLCLSLALPLSYPCFNIHFNPPIQCYYKKSLSSKIELNTNPFNVEWNKT